MGLRAVGAASFDLIFMDCQMPVMDGFECTRRIRMSERGTGVHRTIIATTANAMSSDREDCFAAGMDDYLAKPIARKALLAVIAKLRTEGLAKAA